MAAHLSSVAAALAPGQENPGEMFDIVSEANEVLGQAPRGRVHREGLLHRSVHVLVLATHGSTVLLQQRAAAKTVSPSAWDLSAAEHLQVGEGYEDGARRGLAEELCLSEPRDGRRRLVRLAAASKFTVAEPARGVLDVELVELWATRLAAGEAPSADGAEVVALEWIDWRELCAQVAASARLWTPWLVTRVQTLEREGWDPSSMP